MRARWPHVAFFVALGMISAGATRAAAPACIAQEETLHLTSLPYLWTTTNDDVACGGTGGQAHIQIAQLPFAHQGQTYKNLPSSPDLKHTWMAPDPGPPPPSCLADGTVVDTYQVPGMGANPCAATLPQDTVHTCCSTSTRDTSVTTAQCVIHEIKCGAAAP